MTNDGVTGDSAPNNGVTGDSAPNNRVTGDGVNGDGVADGSAPDKRSTGRSFAAALAGLAGGAVMSLIAVGRPWGSASSGQQAGRGAPAAVADTLTAPPLLRALALAALAAVVAVVALRGAGRIVVGVGVVAAGLLIAGITGRHAFASGGPALAVVGGLLIALAGGAVVRRGRSWPSMSSRYEREARTAARQLTPWEAIDRGEDPTA